MNSDSEEVGQSRIGLSLKALVKTTSGNIEQTIPIIIFTKEGVPFKFYSGIGSKAPFLTPFIFFKVVDFKRDKVILQLLKALPKAKGL